MSFIINYPTKLVSDINWSNTTIACISGTLAGYTFQLLSQNNLITVASSIDPLILGASFACISIISDLFNGIFKDSPSYIVPVSAVGYAAYIYLAPSLLAAKAEELLINLGLTTAISLVAIGTLLCFSSEKKKDLKEQEAI